MCHSCQNLCPSLGHPLLTTVLVCCQGGSPRNAELPQCLRLQGLWGEAEGLERGTDSTILSPPNSATLHSTAPFSLCQAKQLLHSPSKNPLTSESI